jgi:ADP-heptose:LPS heptosyltransferase
MTGSPHVCVFRTDRIGDLLLTLPVAEAVRRAFPVARVTFCAQEYAAPLLRLSPFVDDVITVAGRDAAFRELPVLRAELRRRGITHALFAYPRPLLSSVAAWAGIPRRAGTAYRWYSFLYTDRVAEHRSDALQHESTYNLHLLAPFGVEIPSGLRPVLEIDNALALQARAAVEASGIHDRPYVVLHPGSGGSAKDWPAGHFAALARGLLRARPDLAVLVTGTGAERRLMSEVAGPAGIPVLSGSVSLETLAGILAGASAFVANSTGPLHLASAVGTPVLGLYPFQRVCHPRRWGPLGERAAVLTPEADPGCDRCAAGDCDAHDDMRRISVDRALDALLSLL